MFSIISLITHSLHTAISRIALSVTIFLLTTVISFGQSRGSLNVPHPTAPIHAEDVVREFIELPSPSVGRNDKTSAHIHTRAADSIALVAFYNATGGATWTNRTNWLTTQPINTWRGITVTNDRVVTISLSGNNVSGTLSGAINAITGLSQLSNLVLSNNRLTGVIPSNISSFPLLFQISLWRNQLSGTIPASIGTLQALRFLFLDENSLTGTIPAEIGNLTNLERFDAPSNQLSGSLPSLGKLQKLIRLNLTNNQFSGALPSDITTLVSLTKIYLGNNQFSGSIPAFSGTGTPNLDTLILENNRLTGSIPSSLGTLTKLAWLNLYINQLSGEIPSSLGQLTALQILELDRNQLTGPIPLTFGNLTRLRFLYLSNNRLSGRIPAQLFNSPLERFGLSNNQFTGSIPEQIGNVSSILGISLDGNTLTGSIPQALATLPKLDFLNCSSNQLSGSIPAALTMRTGLRLLDVSSNQLSGDVPSGLGTITALQILNLYNNRFTSLPDLSKLQNTSRVQVNNNHLSFESIEPNLSLPTFIYAPQDSVGEARDTSVVSGSAVRISAQTGGANNQYQWYKNGESISGATQSMLSMNAATAQDSGRYSCRITNTRATALTLWTRPVNIRVSSAMAMTSVRGNNNVNEVMMRLSPNPTSDLLTLEVPVFTGQARMPIVNARGEVVIVGTMSGGERLTIDVHALAPGAYFVRLPGESMNGVARFTVVR